MRALLILSVAGLVGCGARRSRDGPRVHDDAGADGGADGGHEDAGAACEHAVDAVPCVGEARVDSGRFDGEVCVPGGWFRMGEEDETAPEDMRPVHWVQLSPFFLDEFPVTVERYRACVDAGACPIPRGELYESAPCDAETCYERPDSCEPCGENGPGTPVDGLSWDAASAFCAWDARDEVPARLPTEAEFERAVAGLGCSPRRYPWGDDAPTCDRACMIACDVGPISCDNHCDLGDFCEVDERPLGVTPDGISALYGTVRVPTADCYSPTFYASAEAGGLDPICGPESADADCALCEARVWRGVSWVANMDHWAAWLYGRIRDSFAIGSGSGVRCARDAQ